MACAVMGVEDWQLNKNLVECNRHMLENTVSCDTSFLVGIESSNTSLIKAHKYILISRSPVFYAMFCGQMASDTNETIRISDIDAGAFQHMLRYMYCDELDLNIDTVLPILYASKKYMLPILTEKCIKYLEDNLQPDNVCTIYEHSILYEVERLVKKCVSFIETRTEDIVASSTFCDITIDSLNRILKFDKLTISELDLFTACVRWASSECSRQRVNDDASNRRQMLGQALYLVHFPALPLADFANVVSQTGILTAEEKCIVYDYMACDKAEIKSQLEKQMLFPMSKRERPKPSMLKRFTNFAKSSVYSGDCNILKMQCDQNIIVKGFGVSGSSNYDPLTEIQIVIKQDRTLLCNRSIPIQDERTGDMIGVSLTDTVVLKPHTWYTIITTFHFFGDHDQGSCKRGKGGNKTVLCDGVSFEFDRADSAGFVGEIFFCKM